MFLVSNKQSINMTKGCLINQSGRTRGLRSSRIPRVLYKIAFFKCQPFI
jgi:hypothetical protein